ncbi:MAG: DUF2797 domain-containing protein [Myxococcota bacterium]|nr:DUF2797 domain-containing protein [Myxococcota bacterium]
MNVIEEGQWRKMRVDYQNPVQYHMRFGVKEFNVNPLIGKTLRLSFMDEITCVGCGRKTKKSFAQGYCYPCLLNSPETAECIMKPELCRAHEGQGRDADWEVAHHMQPHIVYLAISSGVKVGVTRETQVPIRWIDQGAVRAIPIAKTPNRHLAGTIEVALKEFVSDRTSWQRMLKNQVDLEENLPQRRDALLEKLPPELREYGFSTGEQYSINFPVATYPEKVKSLSFDKLPEIEGVLSGIKGQYLLFTDNRVLNVRKHSGYHIRLET